MIVRQSAGSLRNFCADHPALSRYCAAIFGNPAKNPVFIGEK